MTSTLKNIILASSPALLLTGTSAAGPDPAPPSPVTPPTGVLVLQTGTLSPAPANPMPPLGAIHTSVAPIFHLSIPPTPPRPSFMTVNGTRG